MERLDIADELLTEVGVAVSVPVRTRGSGNFSSPVVLLSNLNAYRRAEGNSSKNGISNEQLSLKHIYEATATLETRAEDEVQSYELLQSVFDELVKFEEFPAMFNTNLDSFSLGDIEQGGFQAPTPEPVYKHTLAVDLDFNSEVALDLGTDTDGSELITSITDDITLN